MVLVFNAQSGDVNGNAHNCFEMQSWAKWIDYYWNILLHHIGTYRRFIFLHYNTSVLQGTLKDHCWLSMLLEVGGGIYCRKLHHSLPIFGYCHST